MDARSANLVAAMALALSDGVEREVRAVCDRSGAATAALTSALAEPGLSVGELSAIVGISGPGVVRLLDRLAADGLIERRAGSDGRQTKVYLTSAGEGVARQVLAARRRATERGLRALTAAEQAALAAAAAKVLAGLTESVDAGCRLCRSCDWAACPLATCPVEQALP